MSSIAAAVAATEEEQVSPHHPPSVYNRTAEYSRKAYTIPPCVYNNITAVLQQK